jgi:Rad3-related DNA helicase
VVVIVPSTERAKFWQDVVSKDFTLTADNIRAGVDRLRQSTGNLAVMVNKYDGIDLPDDACRMLVLDGLPDTRRLIDRYEQSVLKASERDQIRQVQRIEQGMGRAIRSNEDYCVVLLMGQRLIAQLYATGSTKYFSPATARQLDLSRQFRLKSRIAGCLLWRNRYMTY